MHKRHMTADEQALHPPGKRPKKRKKNKQEAASQHIQTSLHTFARTLGVDLDLHVGAQLVTPSGTLRTNEYFQNRTYVQKSIDPPEAGLGLFTALGFAIFDIIHRR